MTAIYKRTAVQPVFDLMRTRRVDVIMIGDSNQIYGGTGREHGWSYALRNAYGLYATGLIPPNSNLSNGNGQGYLCQALNNGGTLIWFETTALTGTFSTTSGSKTITGSGTDFLSSLSVGQLIKLSVNNWSVVKSIESDTSLTIVSNAAITASGQTAVKYPIPPSEIRQYAETPMNEDQDWIGYPPMYIASGVFSGAFNNGMTLFAGIGNNQARIGHLYQATFPTGSGSYRAGWRREDNFGIYNLAASTSTNTGSYGMVRRDHPCDASDTREGINVSFRAAFNGQENINAPFFLTYYRVSVPAKTNGCSVHTLVYRGGRSARRMALDLQQIADTTLAYNLQSSCDLQTGEKTAVVVISSGLNDRNETGISVGPSAVADGDSPEAYVDNIQAIINRVSECWIMAGHLEENLYFIIEPSHPISSPNDVELEAYIDAAKDVADSNARTCVIDMTELTSYEEMQANGWYVTTNDRNHLTVVGYECLATKAISDFVGVPGLSESDVIVMSHLLGQPLL